MIGARLADIRKKRGITQRKLAALLPVSVTTLSAYENDRMTPSDEVKKKISKYFNISFDYFLGSIDEEVELYRKNTLVLPSDFPDDAIPIVKMFVEFIKYWNEDSFAEKENDR